MTIFLNFKIMLNNRVPISLTQLLGNICSTKKCQLQAILNMTTTLHVSLNLIRKMFPVVHTRLGPSFSRLEFPKRRQGKQYTLPDWIQPASQVYLKYQVLVKRREDEPDFVDKSGLSGPRRLTSNFSSRDGQQKGRI